MSQPPLAIDLSRTRTRTRRSARALAVLSLGPLTSLAGLVWAFLQPWRVTVLHPHGQGFWWLVVEPPLLVIAAGAVFALVAPAIVRDYEENGPLSAAARRARPLAVRDRRPAARAAAPVRGHRRAGGLAPPRLASLPLAVAPLRARRPDVARDGPLHELGDPHARPQRLGADDDARRRRGARPRQRQAAQRATGSSASRSRSPSRAWRS